MMVGAIGAMMGHRPDYNRSWRLKIKRSGSDAGASLPLAFLGIAMTGVMAELRQKHFSIFSCNLTLAYARVMLRKASHSDGERQRDSAGTALFPNPPTAIFLKALHGNGGTARPVYGEQQADRITILAVFYERVNSLTEHLASTMYAYSLRLYKIFLPTWGVRKKLPQYITAEAS